MKTSHLLRIAGIFFALFVTAGSEVLGNNFDGKGRNRITNATCVNQISGLSQDQKDKISTLETTHQSTMDAFRESRRSTTDVAKKEEIRRQMDAQVASHRSSVRAILNADQQKQFDQLPRNKGSQSFGNGKGINSRGSGTCNGQGSGRRGR